MDISESSESSSSDDGSNAELIQLIQARIKYGQEWLKHRQDVETKILDNKEWEKLDQIRISFEPPVLEFPFSETVWNWSEGVVGNMRNNYDMNNIAPSAVEIARLRERMDKTNQMVTKWIADETGKLEMIKS